MMRGVHETGRVELPAAGARALAWVGGQLFDVAAGWTHHPLDGSAATRRYSGYGPGLDAASVAPNGDVVALVQSTGTKGLLFDADTRLIREVDRSIYHAEAYRYPIALFTLPSGRTAIVHCPKAYNRLEIEDARTGELLTGGVARDAQDYFHSRLGVSSSGRYLLSAGWLWQPWGCVVVYDLERALADARVLDPVRGGVFDMRGLVGAEISGACFSADDVVVSTSPEPNEPEGPDDLAPNMLARWSTGERRFLWRRHLRQTAGDLLAFGDGVLSLHRHPRLYDAATGELVTEWPDLDTGRADSSIVWKRAFSGPARVAVDETNRRFAVTDGERIVVINMNSEA
jgi:hypothetical protein